MTDKATFTRATATGDLQSLVTNYNANLDTLEAALDDSLSLSGKLPNSLTAPLDANSNRLINLASGVADTDAATVGQMNAIAGGATIGTLDKLDFATDSTETGAVARFVWNDTEGTLDLGLKGGNVTLQVGQEQVIRIVNKTGADFLEANYQCVKISGAQGQRPSVALALANNDANSADTIGLVTETIANNQEGFVTTNGIVRNINTTGSLQGETWAEGDVLYLSGSVAGQLTKVKASAPTHTVIVGFVIHAHATQGKIYVKVDNGYELDELHNVLISSPLNAQVLSYETASGLWKNTTLSGGGAGTTTFAATFNNGGAGDVSGTTFNGSAARTISYNTLGAAPLASPTFTGTPAAPTAAGATNTTQLATTAFVQQELTSQAVKLTGAQSIAGNKTFSGTTALAAGSTIDSIVVGYRDVPVTVTNAAKNFALADAGKGFGKDNGTAYTYTIPANASVAFPIGTVITVFNNNATSNITVAITSDTLRLAGTATTGSRTIAPWALCTLYKVSATEWWASGVGVS